VRLPGVHDDPGEHRVVAAVQEPPDVRAAAGHPGLTVHPAAARLLLPRPFVPDGAVDVAGQQAEQDEDVVDRDAQVQGTEAELQQPQLVRAERAVVDAGHPRMPQPHRPQAFGDQREIGAPVARGAAGEVEFADGVVDHQLDQVLAPGHIPVQRHRAGPDLGGDPAHGRGVQALGVGDPDGRLGDLRAAVGRARPAGGPFRPHPDVHVLGALGHPASPPPRCPASQLRTSYPVVYPGGQ
jgi:hypothetical protein